jgi:cytochrome c-type protein NapC
MAAKPILLLCAFVVGVIFWGGFNWSMELTNTETFCISCHEMEENVYQEYKKTKHYSNNAGVRATCPDCHVPKEWFHKVIRKIGATNELYHKLMGSVDTPEKFNSSRRLSLAQTVWHSMQATDSRECRNCHGFGFMDLESQPAVARTMHKLSIEWDKTCIDCHQGIAHTLPAGFDKEAELDDQHDRMEKEKVACVLCHEGMATAPTNDGWDD